MDLKPTNNLPAFVVAGANSGSGKTTVTLALLAALIRRGLAPAPFKCGPDYIDPLFHRAACGRVSDNLDTHLMGIDGVRRCFAAGCNNADVAVVEGVMGLFDARPPGELAGSTAEIALALRLPVLLVVNARGMAGSLAPLVKGFSEWNPDLRIAGVIANCVGSPSHAEILECCLATAGLPPLVGAFLRDESIALPERHLGLSTEAAAAVDFDRLVAKAEQEIAIDRVLELCCEPRSQYHSEPLRSTTLLAPLHPVARLGVAMDEAFQFYYEENFRLLRGAKVELVPFSPLRDAALPAGLNGLYFGGGYPELHAAALAANHEMRDAVRAFAADGHPVYGECGGYLYMIDALRDPEGRPHRMLGLLPGEAVIGQRAAALGYRTLVTCADSIFGPSGEVLHGHEFHYSNVPAPSPQPLFAARDARERPAPSAAGAIRGSCCGSYAHIHFASAPQALSNWVRSLCR